MSYTPNTHMKVCAALILYHPMMLLDHCCTCTYNDTAITQQHHRSRAKCNYKCCAECASTVQQVLQSVCDWQHSQPEMWRVPPGDQPVPWSWPMLCCVGTDVPMVLQVTALIHLVNFVVHM